jgi:2-oxoglutarate ferredoxin oxidoreductase subunit delta
LKKFKLSFDDQACKGCSLCVNFCPVKILKLNPKRINKAGYMLVDVIDIDKCIGCCFCAMICPDSVITVEETNE